MVSHLKAEQPPWLPAVFAKGVIKLTSSVHGTTRFISSRNTRLRVRLVTNSYPLVARLICFNLIKRFPIPNGWQGFAEFPKDSLMACWL